MRQHSIDLLPDSIRAQSQAGLRMGRFVVLCILVLGALVVAATHSRIMLRSAQERLLVESSEANQVFATEARAADLRRTLDEMEEYTGMYDRIALPLDVSSIAATIINALPDSVTLDQLDLDAGARSAGRSPRSKGPEGKEHAPPRVLTGEVAGFAASDSHIAELVARLEGTAPFRDVNLDFSRTRRVNEQDAREFRLSFKIDLDTPYEAGSRSAAAPDASEVPHVQR